MLFNVTATDGFYIILGDEEPQEGDWVFGLNTKGVFQLTDDVKDKSNLRKIIAGVSENGQIGNLPVLVHPFMEEAEEVCREEKMLPDEATYFKVGFIKAKKSYWYSQKDLEKAIDMAKVVLSKNDGESNECCIDDHIKPRWLKPKYSKQEIVDFIKSKKQPVAFNRTEVFKLIDGTVYWKGDYLYKN